MVVVLSVTEFVVVLKVEYTVHQSAVLRIICINAPYSTIQTPMGISIDTPRLYHTPDVGVDFVNWVAFVTVTVHLLGESGNPAGAFIML